MISVYFIECDGAGKLIERKKYFLAKYVDMEYFLNMDKVIFDKIHKSLKKLPQHVVTKLLAWAQSVELKGLREIRKLPGYHDEPLKGDRLGQRSIRLNKAYRAIYTEEYDGTINLIIIEEVNKHEY